MCDKADLEYYRTVSHDQASRFLGIAFISFISIKDFGLHFSVNL